MCIWAAPWPPPGPCVVWCDPRVVWVRAAGGCPLLPSGLLVALTSPWSSCLSSWEKAAPANAMQLKIHEIWQCLFLVISPCWVSGWFVITFIGETLWMLALENIAKDSRALLFKEKLLGIVREKPAKYLCIASLDKQTGLCRRAQPASHHLG